MSSFESRVLNAPSVEKHIRGDADVEISSEAACLPAEPRTQYTTTTEPHTHTHAQKKENKIKHKTQRDPHCVGSLFGLPEKSSKAPKTTIKRSSQRKRGMQDSHGVGAVSTRAYVQVARVYVEHIRKHIYTYIYIYE